MRARANACSTGATSSPPPASSPSCSAPRGGDGGRGRRGSMLAAAQKHRLPQRPIPLQTLP
eukprot:3655142-Pyramimonas_sp.AAC.1